MGSQGKKFATKREVLSLENQGQGLPDRDPDRDNERRFIPKEALADVEATLGKDGR